MPNHANHLTVSLEAMKKYAKKIKSYDTFHRLQYLCCCKLDKKGTKLILHYDIFGSLRDFVKAEVGSHFE